MQLLQLAIIRVREDKAADRVTYSARVKDHREGNVSRMHCIEIKLGNGLTVPVSAVRIQLAYGVALGNVQLREIADTCRIRQLFHASATSQR